MPDLPSLIFPLYIAALVALLATAAWRDIATRTIPDGISIALIVLGASVRLSQGWAALGTSLLVAIVLFICLVPLCSRGLLGGADLKLTASLAIGFSPQASLHLLLAVTIFGGLLAVIYLLSNKVVSRSETRIGAASKSRSLWSRVVTIEWWRIRRGAPLPYGIAIAFGATVVALQQQGV